MIVQLASYGVLWWLAFVAVALVAARFGRLPGIVAGHMLIAIVVTVLDVQWIQTEMHRPGWNGQPDQDFVFTIGLLIRIILINTFLLPVSALGLLSRRVPRQLPSA